MGSGSTGVDFALIGHAEDWEQVERLLGALRDRAQPPLSSQTIREVFPWIPPRTVERLTVSSVGAGSAARGVYIDTFIPPGNLTAAHRRANLRRVRGAIACAAREGARVASLGGFTSILLRNGTPGEAPTGLALTTGNSLAAALVARGLEAAATTMGIPMELASLLIIGSTGDIGSACARYFSTRVAELCICARNAARLEEQRAILSASGARLAASTQPEELLGRADLVIAVASLASPIIDLSRCRPHAIVCDAGYPKNMLPSTPCGPSVFWGGMGRLLGGWTASHVSDAFYRFPQAGIAHGCMLEGMVLALEGRFEPFSEGRGWISSARMEEIYVMASKHGVVLAPFMNGHGLWKDQPTLGRAS